MICDGMCYLSTRQSFRIGTLHYNNSFLHNFLLFSIVGSTTEKQLRLWRISPFIREEYSAGSNILYMICVKLNLYFLMFYLRYQ